MGSIEFSANHAMVQSLLHLRKGNLTRPSTSRDQGADHFAPERYALARLPKIRQESDESIVRHWCHASDEERG